MLLRSWLIIASLGVFAGCVSGDLDAPIGEIVAAPGSPVLEAEPSPREGIVPNETVELRVRYRDPDGRAVAGVLVDFALTEVAPGASLMPWRARTDEDGIATTRLTVGSMPGQRVVRAGARETGTVYMQVHVGEVVKTRLSVRVAYEGTRKVGAYIVSAVPGLPCDEALASDAVGDVVHRFGGGAQAVEFELDPRERSAIVAWGRDRSGGQLARGCREFAAAGEGDAALIVPLTDTPLRIDRPVPAALVLHAGDSAARFDALARRVVAELLAPYDADAQAGLYLDALAAQRGEAPGALAVHRASLASQLTRAEAGPVALADALGSLLAQHGAGLMLQTRLGPDQATPTVEALHALAADDGGALALSDRPTLSLRSALEGDQAQLVITSLRIDLSLGSFGKALLRALEATDQEALAAKLDAAAGCREVVAPWAVSEGLAEAAVGEAACREVTREVRARYDAALDAMASTPLALSGTLQARDRSEDGAIDELGPSPLTGTWLEGDPIEGEVRAPVQTALVL